MSEPVVTRFAPSPTGFLHIGGARTALFNWLYARHTGGTMLLRIEDTDRERSTDAAITAILDGLTWLGIDWTGEPVFQFARADRHREIAEALVTAGSAYRCYASPDELTEMRERARAEGRPPRYDGRWRDRDPSEAPAGVRPVIRIKSPLSGDTPVDDQVQGRVVFPNKDLDDFVILRSDGTPTYMLSVVVDDHDMGVTHIIRGDDHLTNGARQTILYQALGWRVPVMAHIPLIHGPDGTKLSKRHGALGVEAYRAMGYLPAALRNYLVKLGWSHGDADVMSTADMVAWFDLGAVGRSPSRFDTPKLENLNGIYLRAAEPAEVLAAVTSALPYLDGADDLRAAWSPALAAKLFDAMPGLKERAKTLVELVDNARYLWAARPLTFDAKASELLDGETRAMLAALAERLAGAEAWDASSTEAVVRAFADERGLKLGKVAQPLRAAVTGRTTSPGIFDVLAVVGREESLSRIADLAA
jgi:glutamyl-tRNA synthetase